MANISILLIFSNCFGANSFQSKAFSIRKFENFKNLKGILVFGLRNAVVTVN